MPSSTGTSNTTNRSAGRNRFEPSRADIVPSKRPAVSSPSRTVGGNSRAMIVLDAAGQQPVSLDPGSSTITAQGAAGFMNGPEPQRVVVDAGQVAEVTLTYDTGIR
jgi:hypothetical protein